MPFLFRFLLFGALLYLIIIWIWKPPLTRRPDARRTGSSSNEIEGMKRDSVCGVFVPESQAVILREKGETLYFCSGECREKFLHSGRGMS